MNFATFYHTRINRMLDEQLKKSDRLNAFEGIVDYVIGMNNATEYIRSLVEAILDAFDADFSSNVLKRYVDELSIAFKCNDDSKFSVVLSEENYISISLRNLFSEYIQFINLDMLNCAYLDMYDFFLICGDGYCFEDLNVDGYISTKILNLHLICMVGVVGYPLTWKSYMGYKSCINECECLVTGMSYIRDALNPEFIKLRIGNASNSSQDLFYDFLCFKEALEINKNIKKVIIGLAPYSLRFDLSMVSNPVELYRLFFYYRRFGNIHNNKSLISEIESYTYEYERLRSLFGNDYEDKLYHEICKYYGAEDERNVFNPSVKDPEAEERMISKYDKPYEKTIAENKSILRQYVEYAIQRKVDVTVFIPPFSQWYRERWDASYRDELISYLNELKKDYDYRLIDMSEVHLSDGYFKDFAHLNRLGAIYVASVVNDMF